jgi:hypothetical protein
MERDFQKEWKLSMKKVRSEMVVEMHSGEVSDPIVAGSFFSLIIKNDITFKEQRRSKIEEVCVYEVKNEKIVKEQFFYSTAPQK